MTEKINTINGVRDGMTRGAGNLFSGCCVVKGVASAMRALICRLVILFDTQSLVTVVAAALWAFMSFGIGAYRSGIAAAVVFFIALRPFVSRGVDGTQPCDDDWE